MVKIANEILKRLTARTAGRFVPFLGATIGGSLNFAFIKAIGSTLLAFEDEIFAVREGGTAEVSDGAGS